MNKNTRRLFALVLATGMLFLMQMLSFAADESSSQNASQSVSQASQPGTANTAQTEDGQTSSVAQSDAAQQVTEKTPENPDTGIAVAPFAVALVALASIPVILKTRK